ncbi:thermostable hemolysin, partial [Thiolapillus sp.]
MSCIAPKKLYNTLYFDEKQGCSARSHGVVLMDRSHPGRQEAEKLVQRVFLDAYGARLTAFYPYLLAIHDAEGGYQAVAGLRPGGHTLFCEHYLPQRAEMLLGVPREAMVEIGNLATAGAGRIRWIIVALTAFLQGAGFSTITPLLRNSFVRMGLPLTYLSSAEEECLPGDMAHDWGAYYDCNPSVYAGYVPAGYEALGKVAAAHRLLEVTTHPYQHRAVPKRPFEWRPADCIPDLPWSAGNWRCG